jgi:hypothetical protein
LLLTNYLLAQNYQAINGSPYAGSLAPGSNPAFIINVPYAWDVTPLAVQIKQTTNAFTIENYSFLSSPKNAVMISQNGIKERWLYANQDIRLLNTRININEKSAIAFGANIRNYVYANTTENNWQDTTRSLTDLMKINMNNVPLSGQSINSTWSELYASYAHTIINDGQRVLNAGITLKLNKAVAFGYVTAQELSYIPADNNGVPGFLLTSGSLRYNYSANFDDIDDNLSAGTNLKNFFRATRTGVSADLGLEFFLVSNDNDGESSYYSYTTKIGMSIMDIGRNKYIQGVYSSYATAGLPGITDGVLESKFDSIGSVADFTDSLETISKAFTSLSGDFNVYQPTRLMINVDHHLANDFFISAELSIPLLSLVPKQLVYQRDMNLIAVTPRWETKSFGGYLPVTVNTKGQCWIGAAFKAGPVLLGTHNLGTLFSKSKTQTGGFYLAFTVRPGGHSEYGGSSSNKLTGKQKRSLDCPRF